MAKLSRKEAVIFEVFLDVIRHVLFKVADYFHFFQLSKKERLKCSFILTNNLDAPQLILACPRKTQKRYFQHFVNKVFDIEISKRVYTCYIETFEEIQQKFLENSEDYKNRYKEAHILIDYSSSFKNMITFTEKVRGYPLSLRKILGKLRRF